MTGGLGKVAFGFLSSAQAMPDLRSDGNTASISLTHADTYGIRPDFGIPSAFYICQPRAGSSRNPNQNVRSYPRTQIEQAMYIGLEAEWDGEPIAAANGREYPAPFYVRGPNAANFNIPQNDLRINVNRLVEFPLLRDDFGRFIPFR